MDECGKDRRAWQEKCIRYLHPQDFNLWRWVSDDMERPMTLKEGFCSISRGGQSTPRNTGPHGEAPDLVRRHKHQQRGSFGRSLY